MGKEPGWEAFSFCQLYRWEKTIRELMRLSVRMAPKINFLWAIPMYKEEIEYKLEEGFEAMMDLFTEVSFPRVLDPKRKNYIGGETSYRSE